MSLGRESAILLHQLLCAQQLHVGADNFAEVANGVRIAKAELVAIIAETTVSVDEHGIRRMPDGHIVDYPDHTFDVA